jgi:sortase A
MSRLVGFVGKSFVVIGVFILGFVVYQLWGTGLEESRNQDALAQEFAESVKAQDSEVVRSPDVNLAQLSTALAKVDPTAAPATAQPADGDPVGVIEIPRIGLRRVIVQGTAKNDLKKGPGHYPGTPLPGQKGNAAIAGHRTTYGAPFNRIDDLRTGDEIIITTVQGRFVYTALPGSPGSNQAWYTVSPDNVSVAEDKGDTRITLTACHPKYSARQRIIVSARLGAPPAATATATTSVPPADSATSSAPAAKPAASPPLIQEDEGLGGDSSSLLPVLMFAASALAVGLLAWFVGRRWKRWPVYLAATPFVLVLVWYCYVHLDHLLPAI